MYLQSNFLYGENFELKKGTLVIEGGVIKGFTNEKVNAIKYKGIVIPSLINAHTHVGDAAIKDIGINKTLDELVKPPNGLKHKFLNSCSDEELINGMLCALNELFENGIRYFCDFRENGIKGINLLKKAISLSELNIDAIILGRPTKIIKEEIKKELNEILDNCSGIGLSGANEYSDEALKFIYRCTKDKDRIFAIHASEHEGSLKYSLEHYGKTEIERIIDLKVKPNFIIHATHATPNDMELLKENGIGVVVCPRANASFNVGLPNIRALLEHGILVGIGTDNFMANSPSIFKDMDFIYKIYHIEPKEILKMATINNAKILGIENVGIIKEGYKPSFTFIKPTNAIKYSKNIVASIITRCERGDIDLYFMKEFAQLFTL
ncbi:amidohydrolase family protein [Methanotorris igneus]|uniref:Amidohydrolase n=1 Tax=Methanotorris igneus (strain DSM 5666 / JCM 11834 / Kol 5) TaxID=880724 RepID=F6BCM6_METIK|nr:amidohydrolase family protein [Methanotorris igneus]AEF96237.1 amidohydrolase [Methanotorris igneus Kol 5]